MTSKAIKLITSGEPRLTFHFCLKSEKTKILLILLFILLLFYIIYFFYKKNHFEFFNNFETKFEVIHMSGNEKRFKNIKKQEEIGKIQIDLFEAVNGSKIDIEKLQDEGKIMKPWNTNRVNDGSDDEHKKRIMYGEIGCYMSHMNILQKIANSDYDGWTIIFEDDFLLHDNFNEELKKILNNIDENIDMIYLGNTFQDNCNNGVYKDNLCYPVLPYGTQAYMVNKISAKKIFDLIEYIDNPIDVKYDLLLKDKKINGLVVIPILVGQHQPDMNSTIG